MNNITIFICVFYLVPVCVNSFIFYKMRKQANYVDMYENFEDRAKYVPVANFIMMLKFGHLALLVSKEFVEFHKCWNLLPNITVFYEQKMVTIHFPIWGMIIINYNASVEINEGKAE